MSEVEKKFILLEQHKDGDYVSHWLVANTQDEACRVIAEDKELLTRVMKESQGIYYWFARVVFDVPESVRWKEAVPKPMRKHTPLNIEKMAALMTGDHISRIVNVDPSLILIKSKLRNVVGLLAAVW